MLPVTKALATRRPFHKLHHRQPLHVLPAIPSCPPSFHYMSSVLFMTHDQSAEHMFVGRGTVTPGLQIHTKLR